MKASDADAALFFRKEQGGSLGLCTTYLDDTLHGGDTKYVKKFKRKQYKHFSLKTVFGLTFSLQI